MTLPPLSFSGGSSKSEGAPLYASPTYAGGGVWVVATSGSRADNSGSASTGAAPAENAVQNALPYLMLIGIAVVVLRILE